MTTLNSRGILAVFRSEKIKIGDGANFKWSFGPARYVTNSPSLFDNSPNQTSILPRNLVPAG